MSFAKIKSLRRTLAFRLTFWHAVIFASASSIAFFIFYAVLQSGIEQRTDSLLTDQAKECAKLLSTRGVDAVKVELVNTAEASGTHDIFLRLISSEGREIASSDSTAWKNFEIDPVTLQRVTRDHPVIETLHITGQGQIRVAYASIGRDKVLQIGLSLKDDERLLSYFRWIFASAMAVVTTIAVLVSWLTATRTLSKVDTVTQTALNIAHGSLDARVPEKPQGDEIDRLAAAFNGMLDRIQVLMGGMKEITDNLAHELRSPITRMRGTAETTITGSEKLEGYENMAASTIEDCDRLLWLINTMLDISEAEAGMTPLKRGPIEINAMIQDVCELFAPVAEDKGVILRAEDCSLCIIDGDKEKIQRVMSNLIDNAIKYTPAGRNVSVSVKERDGEVQVDVVDGGIGIAERDIPHIFERFFRGEKSRSERGHGLGLSLARALVRMHGGDISVKSTLESGSVFTIRIPETIRADRRATQN